jgi:hypothetical protein
MVAPAVGYDGRRGTIIDLVFILRAFRLRVSNTLPTESVRVGNYSDQR